LLAIQVGACCYILAAFEKAGRLLRLDFERGPGILRTIDGLVNKAASFEV